MFKCIFLLGSSTKCQHKKGALYVSFLKLATRNMKQVAAICFVWVGELMAMQQFEHHSFNTAEAEKWDGSDYTIASTGQYRNLESTLSILQCIVHSWGPAYM